MIKYNPKFWFRHIFAFHKSDTFMVIWKELIYIAVFTLLLAFLLQYYVNEEDLITLSKLSDVFALVGFVLSLLLVFRTNTAYDRWWEGRKKWGELVNNSRNLAIKISSMGIGSENEMFFKRMIPNYAFAMKEHLRSGTLIDELDLTDIELAEIKKVEHQAAFISKQLYLKLHEMKKNGIITQEEFLVIDVNLKTFLDIIGACERIKNTPIPYSYSSFLKKFIFVFVGTLPLSFVPIFGYYSVFASVFVFYVLVSMEILAEEIEDPFGRDENDLPTDNLSEKIKANVREIFQ